LSNINITVFFSDVYARVCNFFKSQFEQLFTVIPVDASVIFSFGVLTLLFQALSFIHRAMNGRIVTLFTSLNNFIVTYQDHLLILLIMITVVNTYKVYVNFYQTYSLIPMGTSESYEAFCLHMEEGCIFNARVYRILLFIFMLTFIFNINNIFCLIQITMIKIKLFEFVYLYAFEHLRGVMLLYFIVYFKTVSLYYSNKVVVDRWIFLLHLSLLAKIIFFLLFCFLIYK